ncbi:MAG: hypothetical protein AAFW70_17850 [Cyanobacteria bacterium J06635_10]
MLITKQTRQNIIEDLILQGEISGKVELVAFLERTWDLSDMPSKDPRFNNARDDIRMHMESNNDWSENYLFFEYLDIFQISDRKFLNFLENIVHPIVRTLETQGNYAEIINSYLVNDGYRLEATNQLSGFPLYKAIPTQGGVTCSVKNLIFAANGPKPEIVLSDSVSNDIEIVKNADYCLIYDRHIEPHGLF